MRAGTNWIASWCLVILVVLSGCKGEATQVTVRVMPESQRLADRVGSIDYEIAAHPVGIGINRVARPTRFPFDIAVVPRGENQQFRVSVSAHLQGEETIRASLTARFVQDKHQQFILILKESCADVVCDGSCVDGTCVAEPDVTDQLTPYDEDDPAPLFARPTTDAAVDAADAGFDADTGDTLDAADTGLDAADTGLDAPDTGLDAPDSADTLDAADTGGDTTDAGEECVPCELAAAPCRVGCEDATGTCRFDARGGVSDGACSGGRGSCNAAGVCLVTTSDTIAPSRPDLETSWGERVALRGSIAVIAQPTLERAHAFEHSGVWIERWTTSESSAIPSFGNAIATDGVRIVVGGTGTSNAVKVYRSLSDMVGELYTEPESEYGAAVAMLSDTVVVGAPGGRGFVYARAREVTPPSGAPANFNFGRALAAESALYAIGARGSVEVRNKDTDALLVSFADDRATFGRRVALGEDHVAVSSDDGLHIFALDESSATFIAANHTCLAADGHKVFIGHNGTVREYQELNGTGGWVLVARYTTGGSSIACDADGDRLIVGAVPGVYVFGTSP